MSSFKYSEDEIKKLKREFGFSKVSMNGFYNDLLKLKTEVERIYDENVFCLGYALDDAPFHGFNEESLKEMRKIDKELYDRFLEIYSIILSATDSDIQ